MEKLEQSNRYIEQHEIPVTERPAFHVTVKVNIEKFDIQTEVSEK